MHRGGHKALVWMITLGVVVIALAGCSEDEPAPAQPRGWSFTGIWGTGPADVITLGFDYDAAQPFVLRRLGTTLTIDRLDVSDLVEEFRGIFGPEKNPEFTLWPLGGPAGNLHAAGNWGVVYRFNGTTWVPVYSDFQVADWRGVWANDDEVFVVGTLGAILHGDADGFTVTRPLEPAAPNLFGVWGSAPDDVWAVGDVVLRYNGSSWQEATNPMGAHWVAIDGRDVDDVWMGGESGFIMHFGGQTWEESYRHLAGDIAALNCLPGGEVVALSPRTGATDILIFDGSWRVDATLDGVILDAVWGSAVDDIYAIGDGGTKGVIYHRDGTGWTPIDIDIGTKAAQRRSGPVAP